MVYISSDGSIHKKHPRSRSRVFNPLSTAFNRLIASPQAAILAATIALFCVKTSKLFSHKFGPLSNGKIPAASRSPSEHWSYMAKNIEFVRTMTEPLHHITKDLTEEGKKWRQEFQLYEFIEKVDFGGENGHIAEHTDFMDLEGIRVTRCSTTQSAITAYYCGAEKATNADVGHGHNRKLVSHSHNTSSFRKYLRCRHEQGLETGNYHRSVFRLGISNRDALSGYSHAFSIIAQPDGSYFWLQSFIGHYSLATWMKKKDKEKASGMAGVLTYDELIGNLDKIDRLMKIDGWTAKANDDYLDLFNVDKNLEKAGNMSPRAQQRWAPDHRLSHFTWDEACEYPLPEKYRMEGTTPLDDGDDGDEADEYYDKCSEMMLLNLFTDLEDLLDGRSVISEFGEQYEGNLI